MTDQLAKYRAARMILDVVLGPLVGRVMAAPEHACEVPQDEAERIKVAGDALLKCLDALTPEERADVTKNAGGD